MEEAAERGAPQNDVIEQVQVTPVIVSEPILKMDIHDLEDDEFIELVRNCVVLRYSFTQFMDLFWQGEGVIRKRFKDLNIPLYLDLVKRRQEFVLDYLQIKWNMNPELRRSDILEMTSEIPVHLGQALIDPLDGDTRRSLSRTDSAAAQHEQGMRLIEPSLAEIARLANDMWEGKNKPYVTVQTYASRRDTAQTLAFETLRRYLNKPWEELVEYALLSNPPVSPSSTDDVATEDTSTPTTGWYIDKAVSDVVAYFKSTSNTTEGGYAGYCIDHPDAMNVDEVKSFFDNDWGSVMQAVLQRMFAER